MGIAHDDLRYPLTQTWVDLERETVYPGNITGIYQSSDGYVWLYGAMGLQRYDGFETQSFIVEGDPGLKLASNNVTCVLEMKNKELWIATYDNGINIYHPSSADMGAFKWPEKNPGLRVLDIYEDAGSTVWIATIGEGLLRFKEGITTTFLPVDEHISNRTHPRNIINFIKQHPGSSDLLILGTGAGILEFSKSAGFLTETESESNRGPKDIGDVVDCVLMDNKVFMYVWEDGFYEYDMKSRQYQFIASVASFPFSHVNQLFKASSEEIWIASDAGLYTYNVSDGVRLYTDGPPTIEEVFAIERIDNGSIWLSTRSKEQIFTSDPKRVNIKKIDISLSGPTKYGEKITTGFLPVNHGQYLISAFGLPGILKHDTHNGETSFFEADFDSFREKGVYVGDMVALGGNIWVSGITELYLFDPDSGDLRSRRAIYGDELDLKGRPMTKLIALDDDNLVALCDDFVFFFDQETGKVEMVKTSSGTELIVPDAIWDVEFTSGGMVHVLTSSHLFVVDAASKLIRHAVRLKDLGVQINCVTANSKDIVYMGSQNGSIIKGIIEEGRFRDTAVIYQSEGGDPIFDVHMHDDVNLVIRTRCDAKYFLVEEGIRKVLLEDACFRPSMSELNDKLIRDKYLTSSYPFSYEVDLSQISLNDQLPRMSLKELRVNGEVRVAPYDPAGIRHVKLKRNENFLSIDFSLINFRDARHTSYHFMLKGYDVDWRSPTDQTSAHYTGLPPGRYSFLIKAANNDAQWTPEQRLLEVIIVPPWWWSSWAKVFWVLLFSGGIGMVIQNRIRQVRKEESQKYEFHKKLTDLELQLLRVQMNPHFMFNSLNSIKNYILQAKPHIAAEYLSNFAHLIRMILQHSREKAISLFQELEMLNLYVELEQLRFRNGFEFESYLDPNLNSHEISLPPMILQPFVENAIWHGLLHKDGQRKLRLTVHRRSEIVEVKIDDNGIGRERANAVKNKTGSKYKSLGMGIIRERIELVNQMNSLGIRFIITDKQDQSGESLGTLITIEIPLKINHIL